MLTPLQLSAQTVLPALTPTQVMNLMLLVKQYPVYLWNMGLFPGLEAELAQEVATPTIITQALKAVLAAVDELPEIVVESQGRDTAPSHFSVNENWNALALDVLNLFYAIPAGVMHRQSFALAQRKVQNLLLDDDMNAVFINSIGKL